MCTGRHGRRAARDAGWALLMLAVAVLTACRPAAVTPAPPTPTAYRPLPTFFETRPTPVSKPQTHYETSTVLLLGTDRRDLDDSSDNTDALVLVHLDPSASRIAVLSIPRDLWVEIPGHGEARVNTAYTLGEQDGTGGLTLARKTISATLGIPVHHAALLDFHAFVTLVDAIGGVDVDVPYAISDPTYPDGDTGYDPFYLPAGEQHMDGATALRYARTRATLGSDFDRAARQQQLMLAVRDRVTQLDLLPDLIKQSPQLWTTLQTALETDLTLGEVVDLAVGADRIPANGIVTATIDQTCTQDWTTPGGAQVLIPDQAAIEALVNNLFPPPPAKAAAE
jgi:LCP family protein required for cell wall assembly